MLNLRWPLYGRVLGWFFLNLLLLTVVFSGFFRFQFHFGLDSLLAGRAGDRLEAVSSLIRQELRGAPPAEWGETLGRFESAYQVQFAVFRGNGEQIAGTPKALPESVRGRLQENRPPPPRLPRPNSGPMAGPDAVPIFPFSREERHRPREPERGEPARPPGRVMLHAGSPARYWILTPLPPGDLVLVIVSENLSVGGLVFDPVPWLIVGAGVIVLSVLFWLPLVRGITRAISQITAATGEIAAGNFAVRVPEKRRDEIGALGGSINRMAERLAGLVQGQKRFLGDTAHELVSPLARMELALGILQRQAAAGDRARLDDLHEEVRQMSALVGELLNFSKAALGPQSLQLQSVGLRDLVQKTVQREALANCEVEIAPNLRVRADPALFQRGLGNVLRNAQRYAGAAGPILISATQKGEQIELSVADCGPGVPEAALARIFDPFYRLDDSRTRETGGTGLGLAITKTCVEACGGKVTCRNREKGGLEVVFSLRC